jgi:hypothetical protein
MPIVCLGWGSLIWDHGDLPIVGEWQKDGPPLAIEFVRQSKNGRITLTIVDGATPIPVLWVPLKVDTLDEARLSLMKREEIPEKYLDRSVGFWSHDRSSIHSEAKAIGAWALSQGFDGVVWTALKPKLLRAKGTPSADLVLDYLAGLKGEQRRLAEEYVRRTPTQIRTRYRELIEAKLGWKP